MKNQKINYLFSKKELNQSQVISEVARPRWHDWIVEDHSKLNWDKMMSQLFGFSFDDEKVTSIIHPDDRNRVINDLKESVKPENDNSVFDATFRVLLKENLELRISFHGIYIRENGHVNRIIGCCIDVSKSTEVQETLQAHQMLEKTLLLAMSEAVVIYNMEFVPIVYNEKAYTILNLTEEEFKSNKLGDVWEVVNQHEVPLKSSEFPAVITAETGESLHDFVMGVKDLNENIVWISANSKLIELVNEKGKLEKHTIVSYSDITSRIKKVRSQKAIYVGFETMTEGIVIQNNKGMIINMNPSACKILGLSKEQMEGRDSMDPRWRAVREDGSPFPGNEHPISICLQTGESFINEIMGIHKPAGELTWLSVNAKPIFFESSLTTKPDEAICTFVDITERKKMEEVLHQKEQDLLNQRIKHYISGQEVERKRIARELHDGLGQELTGVKMMIDRVVFESQEVKQKDLKNSINNIIEQVKEISESLSPSVLTDLGLKNAITQLGHDVERSSGLSISMNMDFDEELVKEISLDIFRIIQESLNNAIKHAEGSEVQIQILLFDNRLRLLIEDNGIGFDILEAHKKNTHGLVNMKERVETVNGELFIDSTTGKGTTINIEIPIK